MKRKRVSADEVLAKLEADPTYLARRAAREARLRERTERRLKAEVPLIRDLATAGCKVQSIWDLVNTPANYAAAIPVLEDHLQRDYPDDVKEGIVRALAVPSARSVWPLLLRLYVEAQEEAPNGMKTALACALSGAADDSVLDDVASLVRNRSHGPSRMLLLGNLTDSARPDLHQIVEEAVHDPELAKEARFQLRNLRERKRRR